MPPDHDHFNGSVNLDDAGPVMREIVWPIPVGLRRIPDREAGDQANGIFFQLRRFLQLLWLVPARPQPGVVGRADRGSGHRARLRARAVPSSRAGAGHHMTSGATGHRDRD